MPGQHRLTRRRRPVTEYPTWRLGAWSAALFLAAMIGVLR